AFRTQPAVSQSIRQLENQLGTPLFESNRKRVRLTAFGRLCLPKARELVSNHDWTISEITRLATGQGGRVVMAAVPSAAARLLPDVIQTLNDKYPNIELSLSDDSAVIIQKQILSREVDFALTSQWKDDDRLEFKPLLSDRMGVVCRHDHPLAQTTQSITWASLRGQRLINNGTTRLLANTNGAAIIEKYTHYHVSNMISLAAMVESGLGITILPELALPAKQPRLRFVRVNDPSISRHIGLMSLKDRELMPAARTLYELIENALCGFEIQPDS